MFATRCSRRLSPLLFLSCTVLAASLAACRPVIPVSGQSPEKTPPPVETQPLPLATQTMETNGVQLDPTGLARSVKIETISAVTAGEEHPWWEPMPEYRRITLEGYPVELHTHRPAVYIFPAADLMEYNPAAGQAAMDLRGLLKTAEVGEILPFLPLFNAQQVFHAQVRYLEFPGGSGMRYLTQYNQGLNPINNQDLFYAFQGFSSDGRFYISAVLPISFADMPDGSFAGDVEDYQVQVSNAVSLLEQQPAGNFSPDLAQLDKFVQSISLIP